MPAEPDSAQIDNHIIAGLSVDCSIVLYDVRSNSPVRKLSLDVRATRFLSHMLVCPR